MKRRYVFALITAVLGSLAGPVLAELPPLIPREVLFGNPIKAAPRLSPDGTHLAYLAPSEAGVLNVWVRTIGQSDDAMVTNDTQRGIRRHLWAEDGMHVLYFQDVGGDENWHLYSVELASKLVRDLTPFQGVRADAVLVDKKRPNEVLVGLNIRDRRAFDMYRVDLTTGAVVLDTRNSGDVLGWLTDANFEIRGAIAQDPGTAAVTLRVRDGKQSPWRDLVSWPFGENGTALGFTADGRGVYVETSLGSDTTRLALVDISDGQEAKVFAQREDVDVGEVVIHPDSRIPQAVGFIRQRNEWTVLDPSIREDFETLARVQRGEYSLASRDRSDRTWIVSFDTDDGPMTWYIYDRSRKVAERLFENRPALAKYTLAKMEPVTINARDGLSLLGYLTLPVGVEAQNLALVLVPHGGPWARDIWGYDAEIQWLANRGYAVLQVNFRGSTGFGKAFLNAGNGEWGGKMQDDLTDAVRWASQRGFADPLRICIFGGSYGGYATLAGLAYTPDLYACGVDIVGPSNLRTLFRAIPPYWEPIKKEFFLRVGDVENDDALNQKISPLFHAGKMKTPLIVGQGANDPRVNIRESDQMVQAMRQSGAAVTYVVYTDEGHGFARPDNRLDFYGRVEEFLAKTLGGRSEPWSEIKGSSASLR